MPDPTNNNGQSRSLAGSAPTSPQVSESAGGGRAAPQTSQADSADSIPVTRSTTKPQLTPLSIGGAFRSTATHDPIRAISVQLACWRGHARSAIVPILVVGLLSLDVCIHRLGDGLVSTPGRVLVDDRSALAVVAHPDHQIPEPRAAGRREDVPRVAQIVKVQTLGAGTPRIVRVGSSSVKGTRRSFLTASQKRSSGPTLERWRPLPTLRA